MDVKEEINDTITVGDYFLEDPEGRIVKLMHISPNGGRCVMYPPHATKGWACSTSSVRKMKKLTPEEITLLLLKN